MSVVQRWVVKDMDGSELLVTADHWEVSGNGLVFSLKNERIAHFMRWASYWRVSVGPDMALGSTVTDMGKQG